MVDNENKIRRTAEGNNRKLDLAFRAKRGRLEPQQVHPSAMLKQIWLLSTTSTKRNAHARFAWYGSQIESVQRTIFRAMSAQTKHFELS